MVDVNKILRDYEKAKHRGKDKEKKEKKDSVDANGVSHFELEVGDNLVRFLPIKGSDFYYQEYLMHFKVGPKLRAVTCLKTFGEACPVCEEARRLWKEGTKESKALAKSMSAKEKYFSNVINMNDQKGIQVFNYGVGIRNDISKYFGNTDYGDVTNMDTGRNLTITKITGADWSDTKYEVVPRIQVSPVPMEALDLCHDLKAMISAPTREQILDIMSGKEQVKAYSAATLSREEAKVYTTDPVDASEEGDIQEQPTEPVVTLGKPVDTSVVTPVVTNVVTPVAGNADLMTTLMAIKNKNKA